jgi:hypothetical protein
MYDHTPVEEVDRAREAGQASFEATQTPFAPQRDMLPPEAPPDPERMRQLHRNLAGPDGRPDPKKLKDFMSRLLPDDPWRKEIEQDLLANCGMGAEVEAPAPDVRRYDHRKELAEKNFEAEGGADGHTWIFEQTSKEGESEVLVRFTLPQPATKRDVKVVFKVQSLKVTVAGESLFDGKIHGKIYPDESTWSLVEQTELQVLLSLAEDVKWHDLRAKE